MTWKLSADFHWRFFPALLKGRFGNRVAESRTSFVGAAFMQCVLVLFGAIAAAFAGVSFLPGLAGWLLLALAAANRVLRRSVVSARACRNRWCSAHFHRAAEHVMPAQASTAA